MTESLTVIGAGAWGTALATTLSAAGRSVVLWAREAEVAEAINAAHENKIFLPGIKLDKKLQATSDLAVARQADLLLLAVPAQFLRATVKQLKDSKNKTAIICTKGVEQNTLALMSDVVREEMPDGKIAVLSGPSFAAEVAKGLPTALTVASTDDALAKKLLTALSCPTMRLYASHDTVGVQLGGALKNVMAIACGIVEGKGLGDNARAAIIARGLAEMARLGVACGGRQETFMGLSGMGDLVLTCCGQLSRNMTLGFALGQGRALADVLGERRSVAEGVFTASAAVALAATKGVDVPIMAAVDAILNRDADIGATISALLARPTKHELA